MGARSQCGSLGWVQHLSVSPGVGAGPQCGALWWVQDLSVDAWWVFGHPPLLFLFVMTCVLQIVSLSFINYVCHDEYIVDTHDSLICGSIFRHSINK